MMTNDKYLKDSAEKTARDIRPVRVDNQGLARQYHRLSYRPEVDGLRAVAVIAVLIYHARFQVADWRVLPGGFLGVDIFFVISGYLITAILLHDSGKGNLSIAAFYGRRIRRILPALCVVLLATLPFAWVVLLPDNLIEFSQSLVATNLFISNIFFLSEDSYTAAPSLLKPLLHTWSLAVEEQFYLLFPLALVWLRRLAGSRLVWALVILLLASLGFADWSSRFYPSAAFFLMPQRLWELLAGSVLAVYELQSGKSTGGRGLPTLGLGMIIFGFLVFDDRTLHPSIWTVIPIVGTVLLIRYPGRDAWISAILRSRLAIGVGLASYSLYLWHQPIFAFARVSTPGPLTPDRKLILLAVCAIAAFVSWKYIETPCRNRDVVRLKTLIRMYIYILIGFFCFAIAVHIGGGFPSRFPPIVQKIVESESREIKLTQDGVSCAQREISKACRFSSAQANETWFIVGDSTAIRLALPLWEMLRERGTVFIPYIANGCYYAPTLLTMNDGWVQCRKKVNMQRRTELLKSPPATAVLFGQLPLYYSGHFRAPYQPRVTLQAEIGMQDEVQRKAHIRQVIIDSTLELLEYGHRVLLVYPTPEIGFQFPQRLAFSGRSDRIAESTSIGSAMLTIPYSEFRETTHEVYEIFHSIGEHPNLIRVYPEKVFCPQGSEIDCLVVDQDRFYYNDSYHLSYYGAKLLADELLRAAPDIWPRSAE